MLSNLNNYILNTFVLLNHEYQSTNSFEYAHKSLIDCMVIEPFMLTDQLYRISSNLSLPFDEKYIVGLNHDLVLFDKKLIINPESIDDFKFELVKFISKSIEKNSHFKNFLNQNTFNQEDAEELSDSFSDALSKL